MIFLSRLILNPRSRDVQRDLGDCQALHRTIMAAFPLVPGGPTAAREQHGVLFRLDETARGARALTLLVQSEVEPDWPRLPTAYLLETGGEIQNPACKRVDERYRTLDAGAVLRFRLRANPTRKIDTRSGPDGARRNGKRVDLRGEDQQIDWLQRKGELGGFRLLTVAGRSAVPSVQVAGDRITGIRADRRHDQASLASKLTFASVQFDGTLAITDPDRFRETLRRGIGPAKAYGFGLLSIARPTE